MSTNPPSLPPSTSILQRLRAKPVAAALGGMAGAIAFIAEVADLPVLSREMGYSGLFVAAVFNAAVVFSDKVRVRVLATVVAVTIAGLVLVHLPAMGKRGDAQRDAGDSDDRATEHAVVPGPLRADVDAEPHASVRAFDRLWVLHRDGKVRGLDDGGVTRNRFHVRGPASDIIACAGALLIAHGYGRVSRYSRGGKRLARYHYGDDDGELACGAGSAWVTRPAGSVVRIHARQLTYEDEFPVAASASSIAFTARAVWLADAERDEIVGIDAGTKELLGPYPVLNDPRQIVAAGGHLLVMHREDACLMRFDLDTGEEIGPGVPLGRYPARMSAHDGVLSIVDYADGTLRQVDAGSAKILTKPLQISDVERLVDVEDTGGLLSVVDKTRGEVVLFARAALRALRWAVDVPKRSAGCPA